MNICKINVAVAAVPWGGGPQFCSESITFFVNVPTSPEGSSFWRALKLENAGIPLLTFKVRQNPYSQKLFGELPQRETPNRFSAAHRALHCAKPTKPAHPGSQATPSLWKSQLSGDPLGTPRDLSRDPLCHSGDPWSLSRDPQGHSREPCASKLHFIDFSLIFVAFGAFWSQKYQYFIRPMHICQNYVALPAVPWWGDLSSAGRAT